MGGYAYINGSIVPEKRASVPVFDRGFNYGDGIFETMKARDAGVFFLKEHLRRLKEGVRAIGMPLQSLKGLEADIKDGALTELLRKNGLEDVLSYIKIIVTRGGGDVPLPPAKTRPTTVMVCRPLDAKAVSGYQKRGVKAVIVKDFRPAIPWIKSLSCLPNILARVEANKKGAYEAIYAGADSSLSEG
ncbi:MAG: aminotransferase class IV, partial [Deltaproteobacteria bacterium]